MECCWINRQCLRSMLSLDLYRMSLGSSHLAKEYFLRLILVLNLELCKTIG